jgi:hypothetical protein
MELCYPFQVLHFLIGRVVLGAEMVTKESSGTLSKSDVVREYLASHASTPVKEIAAALAEQGAEVSVALINKIKYSDRKLPTHGKRGRRRMAHTVDAKGTSKAQAIRDALTHLGRRSRPRDVIAHLKEGGVVVSPAQVSAVRKVFRKHGGLKRSAAASTVKSNGDGGISIEHLLAAKRLADQVGLEAAKRALEFLVKLSP